MEAEQTDVLITPSCGNKGSAQVPSLPSFFSMRADPIWPQNLPSWQPLLFAGFGILLEPMLPGQDKKQHFRALECHSSWQAFSQTNSPQHVCDLQTQCPAMAGSPSSSRLSNCFLLHQRSACLLQAGGLRTMYGQGFEMLPSTSCSAESSMLEVLTFSNHREFIKL